MRRRDDDLSRFRDDPVVKAITGPATPEELAGEAEALAAFRAATTGAPPLRRSAARVVASGTAAVVIVGLTGGVAAAYTDHLPDSAQRTLHNALGSIGVPAPKHHHAHLATPVTTAQPPASAPAPVPSSSSASPEASRSPAVTTPTATASSSPTAGVTSTPSPSLTPTETPVSTPTPTPTPTVPIGDGPLAGATLAISLSAPKVMVGGTVTVTGQLDGADAAPIADRRVGLRYRRVGVPGWSRLGPQQTASDGSVRFTVSGIDHNLRLVLHSGRHVHSTVAQVRVVPIITVNVPPPVPGARRATITIKVAGGQAGDLVTVRRPGGRKGSQTATLDSTLTVSVTVPEAQRHNIHYRVFVGRTKAHAAHSLPFYVPASGVPTGTTTGDAEPAA
ncbi:MAG TPA: hypothetical protein VHB18_10900 [Mycobacteriales bacterium]|jgi:hypothetical protein|nr:hypothetical protein [Mycobacteriales bacterium]